uniref:Uncharacterized protein n=1 Tax=Hyaloperonospora arabidopsidis (strain Emoy2) TaxID=559515 RepID=M4BDM7_HYAAE
MGLRLGDRDQWTTIRVPRSRDRDQGTAIKGPRSMDRDPAWVTWIFGLPTSENFDTTNWKITPGAIWTGVQGLSTPLNCDRTQATLLVEVQDRETAQVVRRLATQVPHSWHKAIKADSGDSGRAPTEDT